MRKVSLVIALILGSSVILPSYVSAASPSAGAACPKVGLTSSTATKKFTCIKSGKKLVWDKGVAIVKPASAPVTATTSTASTTPGEGDPGSTLLKDGLCVAISAGSQITAHVQLFINGSWKTSSAPVTWQNVGSCDSVHKERNSLPNASVIINDGTKYRWQVTPGAGGTGPDGLSPETTYKAPMGQTQGSTNTQSSTPAAPSPKPTATPTKPPFKALIPIQLPVAPMGPITFANAASMVSSIPAQAWNNIQKEIAANAPVTVPITIEIGPNTRTTADQMIPGINREYQLLNGFSVPPTYHAVVFSAQDEKWGEAQAEKVARALGWIPSNYVPLDGILMNVRNQCSFNNGVAEDCYGGNALGGFLAKDGFSTYGVQSGGGYDAWNIQNQYAGPMTQVTHELTHNMQFSQFTGSALKPGENTRSDQFHHSSPCWFHEGQANAIGIPVFQPTLNDYLNARDGNIQRAINPGTTVSLTDFSAAGITAFLVGQDPLTCSNPSKNQDYQLGYSVGYAATEALIAIGGAQATIALISKGAEGNTWDQAFQAVYGISWADGANYLGQILAAEYAVKPIKKN